MTPLATVITRCLKEHWEGQRKYLSQVSWTNRLQEAFPDYHLEEITYEALLLYRDACVSAGLEPASVYARMSSVSTLYKFATDFMGYRGPVPKVPYPKVPRKLKWWLNPETQQEVIQWLTTTPGVHPETRLFVEFIVLTGFRVEECLALRRDHFHGLSSPTPKVLVPGTKTPTAQATLPLSVEAAALVSRLLSASSSQMTASSSRILWSVTYRELARDWRLCLSALGHSGPTATLKALRRSFTRKVSAKCPLPVLQQLLRHRDPNTTLDYLRLTGGGYNDDELRRYL